MPQRAWPGRAAGRRYVTSRRAGAGACAQTVGWAAAPMTSSATRLKERGIKGRSRMNKAQLERVLGR